MWFYERVGRSVNAVITGYVDLDSSDNGALPGRSTTTAYTPAAVAASASASKVSHKLSNTSKCGVGNQTLLTCQSETWQMFRIEITRRQGCYRSCTCLHTKEGSVGCRL